MKRNLGIFKPDPLLRIADKIPLSEWYDELPRSRSKHLKSSKFDYLFHFLILLFIFAPLDIIGSLPSYFYYILFFYFFIMPYIQKKIQPTELMCWQVENLYSISKQIKETIKIVPLFDAWSCGLSANDFARMTLVRHIRNYTFIAHSIYFIFLGFLFYTVNYFPFNNAEPIFFWTLFSFILFSGTAFWILLMQLYPIIAYQDIHSHHNYFKSIFFRDPFFHLTQLLVFVAEFTLHILPIIIISIILYVGVGLVFSYYFSNWFVLIIAFSLVLYHGIHIQLNIRKIWFRYTIKLLRELKKLNPLMELYLRREVIKDVDWYKGQEKELMKICAENNLSYEELIAEFSEVR